MFACRSQPKLIKDKEKQIQNQLASALDTQNKQFMQLKQLRIEEAPRESHRDVAKKLEHELSSKQDILKIQYRESIERMKESNEVCPKFFFWCCSLSFDFPLSLACVSVYLKTCFYQN